MDNFDCRLVRCPQAYQGHWQCLYSFSHFNCVLCRYPISRMSHLPTDSLSELISARGDQAVTLSQLVTLLERVKEEVLADAQEKSDRLHRQVKDEMSALSALSNRILASICTSTLDSRSSRSRGSSSRRRSDDPPPSVNTDKSDLFANPDIGALEYLKLLMLLTVMAFVSNVPNAEKWVAAQTHQRMLKFTHVLRQVSGFSLILFAVRNTDVRDDRLRTAMGRVRSLLVQWTLARKVAVAKETITSAQESVGVPTAIPTWLQSFGNARSTNKKMAEIIDLLDRSDDCRVPENNIGNGSTGPSSVLSEVPGVPVPNDGRRSRKRRRQPDEIETDPVLKSQMYAVRLARKKLLRALSHGRTGARKKIFSNLLFVLERIWSFDSPDQAKQHGYAVVFAPECGNDDVVPFIGPDMPETSPWKIDLALKRGQATDEIVKTSNFKRFVDLQNDFPGLAVKLKYRIAVRRGPNDKSDGSPEFHDTDLAVSASDDVSLHSVAVGCLLGASRAADFHEVLRTSELSLRAIHVIAFALRGLLKQALWTNGTGPQLSDVEKHALGDVSARLVAKGELKVTAMFGGGTKEKGEGTETISELEKLRRQKLEMSWNDYCKKRETEAAALDQTPFSDASRSESGDSLGEIDWTENAGI